MKRNDISIFHTETSESGVPLSFHKMASEEDPLSSITLKGIPVCDIKLNDLKKELEKRGLSKGGSRAQLNDRLKAVSAITYSY